MNLSRLVITTLALLLLLGGWAVGRAQSSAPDFELTVSTTVVDGSIETAVNCLRGCKLSWVHRGTNPNAKAIGQFDFACKGSNQCPSGAIGGWIEK